MIYYLTATGNGCSPDGTLPAGAVECTQAQYANASAWTISAGTIVAATPPTPTLAQQASAAMAAGLTLTLSGTMTLVATVFPTDRATQTKLAAVATTINTTGEFPGGVSTYPMKDTAGSWHMFDLAQYKSVAAAIAAYASTLDLIIDGNPLNATTLPSNTAALTV